MAFEVGEADNEGSDNEDSDKDSGSEGDDMDDIEAFVRNILRRADRDCAELARKHAASRDRFFAAFRRPGCRRDEARGVGLERSCGRRWPHAAP